MLKKLIFSLIIYLFLGVNLAYGLDWKNLHEKADTMNLSGALAAVKVRPDSVEDWYILGLVYLNLHKDKEAEEAFNKVLSLDSGVIEAKWGIAEALRRQHQLKESEKLLNEVLKINPNFPATYITLGYIKYFQMDFKAAVRLAKKVLDLGELNVDRSNYVKAHLLCGGTKGMLAHYGGLLSKIFNGKAVLPHLKAAEKLKPKSAEVKFGLGSYYLLIPALFGRNLEKAEIYLKQAVKIDPLLCDAYVRLAQVYKIKGDTKRYNEYLNKALKIDPQNELALDIKTGKCKFICIDKGK